ncbi:probable salivary secreted peptide, partial [Chrysoperla carnea]|uniref:probable salivary secreted peptide n=1 Tax=Chrysoperla carnea TaxID=189513 RepID=UPI001D0796C7
MTATKFFLSIVVLAIIACTVSGQSHHWSQGQKQIGDRLLTRQIVQKSAATFGGKVTKDIRYPPKGDGNEIINFINATDQYVNGEGGFVTLLEGGVGTKAVKLHFKSQKGHGFNFILDI